ncbi:hypothetical protein [Photobacterium leiognathi]|uniref:hypothetical protein n=1 Tax=Photobacterium leiognathi TaxID=553611 RepID=UPI002739105C|nr:hypothetical protein [Photobacterium leiognathi]
MRILLLFVLLFSLSANAKVSFNGTGKSLDQFFALASEVMKKTIVADPSIDGSLKIYGTSHASSFDELFYSLLSAYNLSYQETGSLIKIVQAETITLHDADSLKSYVANIVSDVFISGSVFFGEDDKSRKFHYAFVQNSTGQVFDPESLGLKVTAFNHCLARFEFSGFESLVTCRPFSESLGSGSGFEALDSEGSQSASEVVASVVGEMEDDIEQ